MAGSSNTKENEENLARYLETSKDADSPARVSFDDDDDETICELEGAFDLQPL